MLHTIRRMRRYQSMRQYQFPTQVVGIILNIIGEATAVGPCNKTPSR